VGAPTSHKPTGLHGLLQGVLPSSNFYISAQKLEKPITELARSENRNAKNNTNICTINTYISEILLNSNAGQAYLIIAIDVVIY
jgi:hypothetical protein